MVEKVKGHIIEFDESMTKFTFDFEIGDPDSS